jgi:hypothetical protein
VRDIITTIAITAVQAQMAATSTASPARAAGTDEAVNGK